MKDKKIMVISVMDRDRPGIVAEVAEGISALGGNLADLRESVLCGYFTMILVAGFNKSVSAEQVEQALERNSTLRVSVELANDISEKQPVGEHSYVLSAVGEDRVGLVAQVSRFCCDWKVNILDLASHVENDQYTMMLQLDLASIQSLETFTNELTAFGEAGGIKS